MTKLNWTFLKLLRLEVYLLLTRFAVIVKNATVLVLIQDKVCKLEKGFSHQVCSNLHHPSYVEQLESVLPDVNNYSMYLKLILNTPSVVLFFYVGSWLDNSRKAVKILLLVVTVASLLESTILILSGLNFSWPVWVILVASISTSLTGGQLIGTTTVITQATKETEQKFISIRMAIVMFSIALSISLGGAFVGAFLTKVPLRSGAELHNYNIVFIVALLADALAVIWILLTLKGAKSDCVQDTIQSDELPPSSTRVKQVKQNGSSFTSIWDTRCITETFKVAAKRRPDYGRFKIWLLLLSSCIVVSVTLAPLDIGFQFAERTLGWDIERFNYANSIISICQTPVSLLGVSMAVSLFKCEDSTVGIIGSLSVILGFTVRSTFLTEFGYCLSYAITSFESMGDIASKALIKSLAETQEIGRLLTFTNVGNSLLQLALSPLMIAIFNSTLQAMPGFVFIFLALTMAIPFAVFIFTRLTLARKAIVSSP